MLAHDVRKMSAGRALKQDLRGPQQWVDATVSAAEAARARPFGGFSINGVSCALFKIGRTYYAQVYEMTKAVPEKLPRGPKASAGSAVMEIGNAILYDRIRDGATLFQQWHRYLTRAQAKAIAEYAVKIDLWTNTYGMGPSTNKAAKLVTFILRTTKAPPKPKYGPAPSRRRR